MQCNERVPEKKTWITPQLTVYGTVEKITGASSLKRGGGRDGIAVGRPIIPVPGSRILR
jgi:hypothetical protein